MLVPHTSRLSACALAVSLLLSAGSARAQSTLDQARKLYLDAEYEQSLNVLGRLKSTAAAERSEIGAYQVFCLVALGRLDDAARTAASIVSDDPFYMPSDEMASPRIRDLFRRARGRVLPDVARREYAAAKAAFDRKDPSAAGLFERVVTLLDDPDVDRAATADLRVLAEGFRDLLRVAAAAPTTAPASVEAAPAPVAVAAAVSAPPPAAAAPPVRDTSEPHREEPSTLEPPEPTPLRPAREGDPGVMPPIAISQPLPRWIPPAAGVDRLREFDGLIEVVIDPRGAVSEAAMRATVHPQYDPELLRMAYTWRFKPATKDGKPIAYARIIEVRLKPATP